MTDLTTMDFVQLAIITLISFLLGLVLGWMFWAKYKKEAAQLKLDASQLTTEKEALALSLQASEEKVTAQDEAIRELETKEEVLTVQKDRLTYQLNSVPDSTQLNAELKQLKDENLTLLETLEAKKEDTIKALITQEELRAELQTLQLTQQESKTATKLQKNEAPLVASVENPIATEDIIVKQNIKFKLTKDQVKDAKHIVLVGDFLGWKEDIGIPLNRDEDGGMSVDIDLPKNKKYEYRYLVDGNKWINDDRADDYRYKKEYKIKNCIIDLTKK